MAREGWAKVAARLRAHSSGSGDPRASIGVRLRPLWGAVCLGLLMGLLPVVGTLQAGAATTPTQLAFAPQPGGGDPGTALATQPTVKIEDASNAVVSTSSTVTLTLTGSGGAALTGLLPTLTCDQTSGGVTSMSTSSGVAAFTGCKVNRGGVFSLTATDTADNLTQVSSDFFVTGPAQLAFTATGEPNGGAATTAWTTQPQVAVEDGHGVVLTGSTSAIHLAIKSGTGTSSASLSCTTNPVSAVSGEAQFAGCSIDKVGTGYELVATDGTDSLISSPSTAFNITAGTPTSLAFAAQPPGGAGGAVFGTQPQVVVKDAGGNVIAGNTDAITLSIKNGTGTSGANLTCTTNPVSAADGVAQFGGCAIDDAGNAYQLTATDSTRSLSVDSTPFTVGAGAASHIAFDPEPGGGGGGSPFGTQPVVTLTDAGGNPVAGSVTLSIKSGTGTPGAILSCGTNPLAVNGSGAADFSNCSINDLGTGYVVTATSGSLSIDSTPFDVTTGGPAKASFATEPGNGHGGSVLSPQPVVSLTDAGGNTAAGAVTLSITPGTGTPGATLTCANNPVSTTGGSASFSGCSVDKAGTGYTLTATSGTASVTSTAFSVDLGTPAKLGFTTQPGGGTGGTPWTAQPVVTVEDAGGNQLPTSTSSIALAVTPLTGSGTLHCDANSLPAVRGAALFNGCSIDKTASAYTLTATDSADGLTQTSLPFAVTPGPAAEILFTAQPGGGTAGSVWATQPVVAVADGGGNVTSSTATVALGIAPGTGTAGAALACASNAVGAVAGTATFSGCSINRAGGGYTLVATDAADGLQAESLPFSVLTPPPGPLEVAPTGIPLAQTFGNSLYGANPTDTVDDVNSATGALTFAVTDLRVAGIGEPLVLNRTYNSADTTGGSFGPGWSSILDASVSIVQHQTLTLRGEDGQQIVFTWNPSTRLWAAPPGAKAAVSCNPVKCTVTRFDGVTMGFNIAPSGPWHLASYNAPDGQGLSFAWTSSHVTITIDTANKPSNPYNVIATLDGNGHVTGITTPAGRSVSYAYSAGRLSSVTDVRGHVWNYAYNGSGLLTTETDPSSHVRLTATYGNDGRVSAVSSEGSPKHTNDTFSYAGGTTTRGALIDANGSLVRAPYVDQYVNNVLVAQTTPWGGITRYSYDGQVNMTETQDALGWVEQLSYDAGNNLISQSTPISSTSSSTVKMTYDNQHRLVTQTDADGNTTTYQYVDEHLNQIYPPGAGVNGRTQVTYNKLGELVKMVGPTGQQLYTYDSAGNQTSIVLQSLSGAALNGPGTRATYDEAGDVTSRTDANGNTTTYTYDAAGNLLTTVAPGPQTTTNTYTPAGDVASTTDAAGNTTTYSWNEATLTRTSVTNGGSPSTNVFDPSGALLTETNAANRTTTHVFDVTGREVSTTDPANVTTQYTYDLQGNIVGQADSAGNVVTQQFDSLNRTIRQDNNGAVTLTTYDPAGNVVSTTSPTGAVTNTTYTAQGKPASVSNAAGTTSYTYDPANDVLTSTDPNHHVTSYGYDGAGRETSATVNGNTTSYTYDNNGNVKTATDPDGRTTTNSYNALNQATSTTYSWAAHPSLTVTQSYDALGRRTGMTDADGTVHTYTYDVSGDLTKATSGSDTFTYDYSQPGKIVETYPDGTNITYAVDDQQNIMSVQSGTQGTANYVAASYIRNQSRETTGISYSNGVLETQNVNQAGQVTSQSLQLAGNQLASDATTYDAAGNPLSQVSAALGTTTTDQYGYDSSERLTGFSSATAPTATSNTATTNTATTNTATTGTSPTTTPSPTSTFLGAPNKQASIGTTPAAGTPQATTTTASTNTAGPNQFYSYDAAGNIVGAGTTTSSYNAANELTSQSGGSGATSYTYDKNGDRTSATGPNGTTHYNYNAADQLVRVITPSSTISYTYDGDGNRTSKTVGSSVTQYVWDIRGAYPRLAIERTGGGALIRRYFYGDGPVAMQTPTATYFYHLNPQGSVAEISDSTGAIVAAYTYDAYGNVTTSGANAPANPLLFQGQYLDPDTGLYDMHARNYDPKTGIFTQRDPLAPVVGQPAMSTYAYGLDRPTSLTDPTGRSAESIVSQQASTDVPGTETITNAKVVSIAFKPTVYTLQKTVPYIWKSIKGAFSSAEDALASGAGAGAEAASEVAGDTGTVWAGEEAAQAGEEVSTFAKVGKFLGPIAIVGSIALGVATTVIACENDSVSVCVGDAVGEVVGNAIAVACLVESAGAAAVACGLAAGLISAGLTEVIARYGPAIAEGVVTAYNAAAAGVTTAVNVVTQGLESAANTLDNVATSVGGAIATGFNEATTAISSGFQTAMNTLVDAGYSAAQLATTLANDFAEGVNQAVGTLVNLGYSIQNVAEAAINVFSTSAVQFAQIMKDGFNYTVQQVAGVLKDVYNLGDQVAAQILKGVNFAVDQVASALQSVYNDAAAAVATVLQAINYGVAQIGAALQQVFAETDQAVAVALKALGYAAGQVAGALVSLYNDIDSAVATALDDAAYTFNQIAGALDVVFNDVGQVAAGILKTLNTCTSDGPQACVLAIAGALQTVYSFIDVASAQVLENIGFVVNDVATALKNVYGDIDTAVASALRDIGNTVTQIGTALNVVFTEADAAVATALRAVGYAVTDVATALHTVFSEADSAVAGVLQSIGYAVGDVATALANVFADAAQQAASVLKSFFSINDVSTALSLVFGEAAQGAAQILKNIGYDTAQIAGALQSIFGEAAAAAAQILKNIGEAASEIASALQTIFGEAVNDIGNILSDIGFSSSDIQAVASALGSAWNSLSSFGQSVSNCFTSGFTDC
ncbi:MAG TPA: RHS repeat-associated core domain-containing protein [Acidimicrobiales bacterium]|nr:RHS repeat-associated core domain-containing protein [Acidimicrobiales bacterium]